MEFMTLHQTCFHFELGFWEETWLHSGTAVPSILCFVLLELTDSGSLDGKTGMKT